jgi:hypothetical protein
LARRQSASRATSSARLPMRGASVTATAQASYLWALLLRGQPASTARFCRRRATRPLPEACVVAMSHCAALPTPAVAAVAAAAAPRRLRFVVRAFGYTWALWQRGPFVKTARSLLRPFPLRPKPIFVVSSIFFALLGDHASFSLFLSILFLFLHIVMFSSSVGWGAHEFVDFSRVPVWVAKNRKKSCVGFFRQVLIKRRVLHK